MPKARLRGVLVHYQQRGRGTDLVMVHGLLSSLAFWYLSSVPMLSRDLRVTVYDLRGHGYTDMSRRGYTSRELAADLCALLDHLGIDRAHVVGHSYGGAVALHFAALHPERVLSVTEADGHIPCYQPRLAPRRAWRWKRARLRLRRAGVVVPPDLPRVAYPFLEELARMHRAGTAAGAGPVPLPVRLDGRSHAEQRWSQLMQSTSAPKDTVDSDGLTRSRIRRMDRPALAMYGQRSHCLGTLRGLEQTLQNCRTVIVPDAGHLHPVVDPERFTASLKDFITETGG